MPWACSGPLLYSSNFICLFLSSLIWTDNATNSGLDETFSPSFHMNNSFTFCFGQDKTGIFHNKIYLKYGYTQTPNNKNVYTKT